MTKATAVFLLNRKSTFCYGCEDAFALLLLAYTRARGEKPKSKLVEVALASILTLTSGCLQTYSKVVEFYHFTVFVE